MFEKSSVEGVKTSKNHVLQSGRRMGGHLLSFHWTVSSILAEEEEAAAAGTTAF